MPAAVWVPAVTSLATGIITSQMGNDTAEQQLASTDRSSADAIALQKQIYDQQRADQAPFRQAALDAIGRADAIRGNNRQLMLGADGKITAGPLNSTLGAYAQPVNRTSSTPSGPAPMIPTNNIVVSPADMGMGLGDKAEMSDRNDMGMSATPEFSGQLANGAQWVTVVNGMGQTRQVPSDQIPSGWHVLGGSVGFGGAR